MTRLLNDRTISWPEVVLEQWSFHYCVSERLFISLGWILMVDQWYNDGLFIIVPWYTNMAQSRSWHSWSMNPVNTLTCWSYIPCYVKICRMHHATWHWPLTIRCDIFNSDTLREESSQTNVILQYKLLAAILSAVCSVIQQYWTSITHYMMWNMTVKLPCIRPYFSHSVLCY